MSVLTPSEVASLRASTPGCANVLHFNHAGASLMPDVVIDATVGHLQREAAIGGYEAAGEAKSRLEAVYDSLATLIGAHRDEIAIVENATRAWDMAFYAIPFQPGDRILTTASEYASNVIAFLQMQKRGVSVEVVARDDTGEIDLNALRAMLDERVRLVAVTHMPTNGGLLQPAAEIGRLTRAAGAIFLLDTCQTVGQVPVDVNAIGCDILSATSRKYLRGPRGMGLLYVRSGLIPTLEPPMLDLHAATWTAAGEYEIRPDARRFENWESFVAGRLGMGVAADLAMEIGLDRIWSTVRQQATHLRTELANIPGITVRDLGRTPGGIVTFDHVTMDAAEISNGLAARQINTVTSSVFSTRFDMEARGLTKLVRASVHYLTTAEEIDALVAAVAEITASRGAR